ncbi:MAG: bifunctional phosphoglucose/phosphomannose isomerase [Bacillota bacterium]|jgi:glucose/mannose-6-phosphate isomerase|nr:bifunctional phosphoglucose/phosphomannose isomerase [Bacillota bacterium]
MQFNLDDIAAMEQLDPGGMTGLIVGLPDQLKEAHEIGLKAEVPEDYSNVKNVVISGLGGSAIGGDLLRSLATGKSRVPISVNRDYDIPAYVGPDTLFVASSYSGNTEETLAAFDSAVAANARVLCISSGGELTKRATDQGIPVIKIPGGPAPRAALGYSFLPLLIVMRRLGLVEDDIGDVDEMLSIMVGLREVLAPQSPESVNQAKQLARRIHGKLPIIYGAEGYRAVVAQRWKGQVNENSKAPAYWNVYPELNHNEIVGWKAYPELLSRMYVINLRDKTESPKMQRRIEVTSEIIKKLAAGVEDVWAVGKSDLAKLFSLVYIGDFVSLYLAFLNNEDPLPVESIAYLKSQLAQVEE